MDHIFDTGTNSSVTVGATSTLVVDKRSERRYCLLVNDSDEVIYLALGADAVMNKGIPIWPTGYIELDGTMPFKGLIRAICASGGKNLTIFDA